MAQKIRMTHDEIRREFDLPLAKPILHDVKKVGVRLCAQHGGRTVWLDGSGNWVLPYTAQVIGNDHVHIASAVL